MTDQMTKMSYTNTVLKLQAPWPHTARCINSEVVQFYSYGPTRSTDHVTDHVTNEWRVIFKLHRGPHDALTAAADPAFSIMKEMRQSDSPGVGLREPSPQNTGLWGGDPRNLTVIR